MRDHEWYDTFSSYYTPKQNLYRFLTDDSWVFQRHWNELGIHPKSYEELDLILSTMGY